MDEGLLLRQMVTTMKIPSTMAARHAGSTLLVDQVPHPMLTWTTWSTRPAMMSRKAASAREPRPSTTSEQRTASMSVPTMTKDERARLKETTREEKDCKIIAAKAKRLGETPTGTLIVYTDGGGGKAHENAGWEAPRLDSDGRAGGVRSAIRAGLLHGELAVLRRSHPRLTRTTWPE